MRSIAITFGALATALPAMAFAQTDDGSARDHAVDQLVGSWVYQSCAAESSCATVERTYEPTADDGLLYYTESVGGEQREGFVGYDASAGTFVEYDYPQEWTRDDFQQTYLSEQTDLSLRGEETRSRMLEWQMNEDGDTMSLRTASGGISESTGEFLGVVFSRVPIVGSDPLGGGDND